MRPARAEEPGAAPDRAQDVAGGSGEGDRGPESGVSSFGPIRLKEWFDLAPSRNSIGRILKEERLTKRKRKKREKQADLRAVKARYKALTLLHGRARVH
jgi:hypothetical protein